MNKATVVTAQRYHDISCGHRVVGHEAKCRFLHGHNYRIHFECSAKSLDNLGRVIDFGVIKTTLCQWLENEWDHKFLVWEQDSEMNFVFGPSQMLRDSLVWVPFNPTAENMALHLLHIVGPRLLINTGVVLVGVKVEETRKCSAEALIPAAAVLG